MRKPSLTILWLSIMKCIRKKLQKRKSKANLRKNNLYLRLKRTKLSKFKQKKVKSLLLLLQKKKRKLKKAQMK